jgi:hypothetical protein
MRLSAVSSSQRRLLAELTNGISSRLEAHFIERPGGDGEQIGVELREGDRKVTIEVPLAVLIHATQDPTGREILRTRIKARRDRMMFRTPPRALPKEIAPMFNPAPPRAGFGRGGRR